MTSPRGKKRSPLGEKVGRHTTHPSGYNKASEFTGGIRVLRRGLLQRAEDLGKGMEPTSGSHRAVRACGGGVRLAMCVRKDGPKQIGPKMSK